MSIEASWGYSPGEHGEDWNVDVWSARVLGDHVMVLGPTEAGGYEVILNTECEYRKELGPYPSPEEAIAAARAELRRSLVERIDMLDAGGLVGAPRL